ncbi:O-antigen polymerase [Ochrobactrum chromiisoli]|uniref:O-antigen ligase n=1 Tax=Ochrobactrum chromiisoli TaxID=2993941 RepID=A0ABT3QP76_9HYPH|nr:O-antigen polymerase [Ochrobactrum chromiisoli]MCX2697390.1 O-antigen ligase [Ochrobactrum chromiisoli]
MWGFVGLSLYSMKALSAGTPLKLAISLVIVLHFLWMIVLIACVILNVMPVMYTPARWATFNAGHLDDALIGAAQVLYLMTFCLENQKVESVFFYRKANLRTWAIWAAGLLVSFFINRTGFVLSGQYSGNQNSYWSGLPAIFVLLMAAFCLNYRKPNIAFFFATNLIAFYWIMAGNRSEILTFVIFSNVTYLISALSLNSEKQKNLVALLVLFFGFVVFSFVGLIRGGAGGSESMFASVFGQMFQENHLSVSTVGSSVYSGVVAIDASKRWGAYYGMTFFGQFINIIPSFIPTPWERYVDPYRMFESTYQTMGGFGILGEGYMNFGVFGAAVMGLFLSVLMRKLMVAAPRSFFASWFLLSFALYSQRFFYYGYVYLHNLIILFLVIWITFTIMKDLSRIGRTRHV